MTTTPTTSRRGALLALSSGALLATSAGAAQAAPPSGARGVEAVDEAVARFMREFEIPGIGVAIVRPGEATYLKGYGVRTLGQAAPVDINTQFAIASNSK